MARTQTHTDTHDEHSYTHSLAVARVFLCRYELLALMVGKKEGMEGVVTNGNESDTESDAEGEARQKREKWFVLDGDLNVSHAIAHGLLPGCSYVVKVGIQNLFSFQSKLGLTFNLG